MNWNTRAAVPIVYLMMLSSVQAAESEPPLVLSAVDQPAYRPLYDTIFKIIDDGADRFAIQLSYMPNVRQLTAIETGKVDGIGIRTEDGDGPEGMLIKVEPALFEAHSVFAVTKESTAITDRASLEGLKIGVLNGSAHCQKIVPLNSAFTVNSHASGLKMVAAHRVDAMCILDLAYYATMMETPGLSEKIRLARLSNRVEYFVHIHPRRRALLPDLQSALKKSTQNGQLQKVYDRIIDDLKSRFQDAKR